MGVKLLMAGLTTVVPMSPGYGGYETTTPASDCTTTTYGTTSYYTEAPKYYSALSYCTEALAYHTINGRKLHRTAKVLLFPELHNPN